MPNVNFMDIRCVITLSHDDVESLARGTTMAQLLGSTGVAGAIIDLASTIVVPVLQAECALCGHRGVHITIIIPTGTTIPTPNFPPSSSSGHSGGQGHDAEHPGPGHG